MLSTLRRWLGTATPEAGTPPQIVLLTECVRQLEADVQGLLKAEIVRSAEHAARIDQLDRLYKRVSARIARGEGEPTHNGESPLALRQRLGR